MLISRESGEDSFSERIQRFKPFVGDYQQCKDLAGGKLSRTDISRPLDFCQQSLSMEKLKSYGSTMPQKNDDHV